MAQLESLMKRHFVEYASYFILDRAIPEVSDGLKPVQRRLLHTLFEMNDGRFHKLANVIGDTMKLHPHGDQAIGDALVVLANKGFFIERQGNFGNLLTGHPAAAARYIECRLTPLALETMFNEALTEFVPSYDGRTREPRKLPAKLPVVLMLGTEGIAVGMSTKLLPHNLRELWEAQIAYLSGESSELYPDFPQGGIMDVSQYEDGRGRVEVQGRLETKDDRHILIREIPYGTTTESVIASIEAAAQKGRVKISSIDDFTTDSVEIEVTVARGMRVDEVIPQLLAYTDCRVSVSSNPVVIRDRRPVEMSVTEMLGFLTEQLREQIRAELEYELSELRGKHHWLTLEQIFVEKRVYKRIEEAESAEAVRFEVRTGMEEFADLFIGELQDDDVTRLLDLRIRRISAYDIERNRSQIEDTLAEIAKVESKLGRLTETTIEVLYDLLERFGGDYPRRTEVSLLDSVDKKAASSQTLKLGYDPETGFFGSQVKGEGLTVSEYDVILAVCSDGSYRVLTPPDKVLLPGKALHLERFDPEVGVRFTVVYRDGSRIAYAKRIHIQRFIRNREYRLFKDSQGSLDHLLPGDAEGTLEIKFAPAKRQRVKSASFDLAGLEETGVTARGTRLAAKAAAKIQVKPAAKGTPRPKSPKAGSKAGSAKTGAARAGSAPAAKTGKAKKPKGAVAPVASGKKKSGRKPKKSPEKKPSTPPSGGEQGGDGQGSLF